MVQQPSQARRLVERWGGGGGGGGGGVWENKGRTNMEDIIGGGCGRGLCPLPPTRGYGGALEATPSGPGLGRSPRSFAK